MHFTFTAIEAALASYLWPFFRISAMLMTMAVIGGQNVPVRIRLAAALAITIATVPGIPPLPTVPLFSLQSFFITLQQMLIGIAVGLVTQFVLQTFILAGQFIGMQTSLGFANIVDPSNGQTVPVIGQLFLMLATLIFLVIDGHLLLIHMLADSFHTLPVGSQGLDPGSWRMIATWFSWVFAAALAMSISELVALLVINIAFGIMTRAAPQLNIFTIGFPVTMVSGIFLLWLTLTDFNHHFDVQWQRMVNLLCDLLGVCS
jgi:flagellar biosynthesis protein FliR